MTHCDSYAHEADAEKLEDDEDVGVILADDGEYQRVKQELAQLRDALTDKCEKLELLRSQETRKFLVPF